jgi:hypothetical protein
MYSQGGVHDEQKQPSVRAQDAQTIQGRKREKRKRKRGKEARVSS